MPHPEPQLTRFPFHAVIARHKITSTLPGEQGETVDGFGEDGEDTGATEEEITKIAETTKTAGTFEENEDDEPEPIGAEEIIEG